MILDLHIHSKYSFDSILHPKDILKIAKKKGLNGIAITDHNTLKGSIEAKNLNQDKDFLVITPAEFATNNGDIIGLFLKREIKERDTLKVIEAIQRQGGIAVLPHPYKGHNLTEDILRKIDVVECFNSRTTKENNNKAKALAMQYNKPMIAGSDAHFAFEIGASRIMLKSNNVRYEILNGKVDLETKSTPLYFESLSQMIKSLKVGTYNKLPLQCGFLIMNVLRKR